MPNIMNILLLFIIIGSNGMKPMETETLTRSHTLHSLRNHTTNANEGFIRRLADTNEWINTGQILPRGDSDMAVAYWNNTFYLFGMSVFITLVYYFIK